MVSAKYTRAQLVKRYAFLCVGLLVMAFGVAFSIKAGLGTSPISSLPYVASLIVPFSVGTLTIAMHVVFVLIQFALLRADFDPIQLMQIPVGIVFGLFIDFALWCIGGITYTVYVGQWLLCLVGIGLCGFGVCFEVIADVVVLAGEGVSLAIVQVTHAKFGNVKVAFDCTLVAIAVALSLACLGMVAGVREGTLAAAILVGMLAKRILPIMQPACEELLK